MKRLWTLAAVVALAAGGAACGKNPAAPNVEHFAKVTLLEASPAVGSAALYVQTATLKLRVYYDLGDGRYFAHLSLHNSNRSPNETFSSERYEVLMPPQPRGTYDLTFTVKPSEMPYGVRPGDTIDYFTVTFDHPESQATWTRAAESDRITLNWRVVD